MKKALIILLMCIGMVFISCSESNEDSEWECGTYNEHTLYTGPREGCYYYNDNGNKTYVDRSECNC